MIDPQSTAPGFYQILKFSSSLHMVKDDWPPYTSWLPRILPEILILES